VQAGRRRGAKFIRRIASDVLHKAIDQIVEAFIPEMERISRMDEGEEQKERHYKAWLRATLQKFADDVREIEASQRGRAFSRPPCSLIPHCRASVEARGSGGSHER
jgi:hypothetical protein